MSALHGTNVPEHKCSAGKTKCASKRSASIGQVAFTLLASFQKKLPPAPRWTRGASFTSRNQTE
eukprot:3445312-Amphidinium_carterae.2